MSSPIDRAHWALAQDLAEALGTCAADEYLIILAAVEELDS